MELGDALNIGPSEFEKKALGHGKELSSLQNTVPLGQKEVSRQERQFSQKEWSRDIRLYLGTQGY